MFISDQILAKALQIPQAYRYLMWVLKLATRFCDAVKSRAVGLKERVLDAAMPVDDQSKKIV